MSHIRKICVSALLYYTYILNAEVNVTKIEYDGDNIASGMIFSFLEKTDIKSNNRNKTIFLKIEIFFLHLIVPSDPEPQGDELASRNPKSKYFIGIDNQYNDNMIYLA